MTAPKIVDDTFETLLSKNIELAKTKVPEGSWDMPSSSQNLGVALLKLFTHMQEEVYSRLNRVPDKNLEAFLEMLGINPLPPKPSRVPITFYPADGFPEDIYIPEGTPLASPQTQDHAAVNFETLSNFSACDASITGIFSVDPLKDIICDHLSGLQRGKPFKPFKGENLQRHILYLGHSTLFEMEGNSSVTLRFTFLNPMGTNDLQRLIWEYSDQSGKTIAIASPAIEFPLGPSGGPSSVVDITLTPSSKINQTEVNGVQSLWITSRPDDIHLFSSLPVIKAMKIVKISPATSGGNTLTARPDFTFYNFTSIDPATSKIYPLGKQPRLYDSFCLSSREIFSKAGATVTMKFDRSTTEVVPTPSSNLSLNWEYFDGTTWKALTTSSSPTNDPFTNDFKGTLTFICPEDLRAGDVFGINNYWIRAILVMGDYGKEKLLPQDQKDEQGIKLYTYYVVDTSNIKPPIINSIALSLNKDYDSDGTPLECCFSYNNMEYIDLTSRSAGDPGFKPFIPLPETKPTLYLGFDNPFRGGNVSTYFYVDESDTPAKKPVVRWSYWSGPLSLAEGMTAKNSLKIVSPKGISKDTKLLLQDPGGTIAGETAMVEAYSSDGSLQLESPLDHLYTRDAQVFKLNSFIGQDNTENLTKSETLEFLSPGDQGQAPKLGLSSYWLAGTLESGEELPMILGIYPNTVWAGQGETVKDEVLGSSGGDKGQVYAFLHKPVISSEVWVREGTFITESERSDMISQGLSVQDVTDHSGKVIDAWVRWKMVEDLYSSGPTERHYLLDQANGHVTFGNGTNGMIPPVGTENIKATYKWGGGTQGNLAAGEVNILRVAIAGIDKIANNLGASGGSDAEDTTSFLEKGPYRLRHRDRAVTTEDFERIARASNTGIARIKCVSKYAKVKIIVIPADNEDRPLPTQIMLDSIKSELKAKALASLNPESIVVEGPTYVEVKVRASVVPTSIDLAVPLKKNIITRLKAYLHPLTGGSSGVGWAFGRGIHISEINSLIQGMDGVDHVKSLTLNDLVSRTDGKPSDVILNEDEVVCSGDHSVTITLEA